MNCTQPFARPNLGRPARATRAARAAPSFFSPHLNSTVPLVPTVRLHVWHARHPQWRSTMTTLKIKKSVRLNNETSRSTQPKHKKDVRRTNSGLVKIANVEDEGTGDAFELYEFPKPLGRVGRERLARIKALNESNLREFLIGKNWVEPRDKVSAEKSVAETIREQPREHWLCTSHVGWRTGFRLFVLHRRVVGATGGELLLKPPLWLNDYQNVSLTAAGDLATWELKLLYRADFRAG